MSSLYWVRMRAAVALGVIGLLTAGTTMAATITVQAQKVGYARDACLNAYPVADGQFDAFYLSNTDVSVSRTTLNGVQCVYRTGVNFQLPPELLQPGTTINSAKIRAWVSSESVAIADVITVHGIPGSAAPFVPVDFELVNPVAAVPVQTSASWGTTYPRWPMYREFHVVDRMQSLVSSGQGHASFTFSIGNWGTSLTWGSGLSLILDYTVTNGTAPTLSILAPASGLTVLQGDPVDFSATATDAEDGPLDAAIQWTSNKNGPIGSGGSFSTTTLSPGEHVITATVLDANGNTVSKTINLNVQSIDHTPPTITLLAPTQYAYFVKGTAINFEAIASDAYDGDRSAHIQWSSSIDGVFGSGGSISTTALSVGVHQITITVADTATNTAAYVFNIVVQAPVNTAPTVTILSPANGASLTAGVSFNLAGTASDTQQGNMSSSIQWILDGAATLATGSNANVAISTAGAHTITARVTDSGGLFGEQSVSVNVASAPPPPASYCSLRANTSSYEWIGAVRSGSVNNVSGNNGGYRDYTSVQLNMMSGAGNTVVLTPGFGSGSYTERWSVWIDLNRDMTFSANELLVNATSSSALTTTFTVPAGTSSGPTRMRVAMSYGNTPPTCGTFSYGEVEDYTVNIQSSGAPPPSGPAYCASRGTTSTYEFIQQIAINTTTRVSGNNSGYADFTSSAPIALARGANPLTLTPGFSGGSYSEQWMIWIDFNKDGVFGTEDWVFGNGGTSAVNGSLNVPTSAVFGITRMRVQMKYAAAATSCETFGYGEVEDYAVQIQ